MSLYASTLLTRSPTALLSQLSRLSKTYKDNSSIFALSCNIDAPNLSSLVHELTNFSSETAGCLSAPLPGNGREDMISCSVAVFDKCQATMFRSTIPGREAPQVGRWHSFRRKVEVPHQSPEVDASGNVDWNGLWDRYGSSSGLPIELQHLKTREVDLIVYFSDPSHEGLSNNLDTFSNATKLGLISASTPFVTGRPVTLFHNQSVYSSGAVGVALSGVLRSKAQVDFTGLTPLSKPLTVTAVEGNIINELNGSSPTQLLLSVIEANDLKSKLVSTLKEEVFYCGVLSDGQISQVYAVTAGDPSRGNLSLACSKGPSLNATVQFFHKSGAKPVDILQRSKTSSLPSGLSFIASEESTGAVAHSGSSLPGQDEVQRLENTFVAASENGFVLSRREEAPWLCAVPGSVASLEWSS
ncbi:hypothetical protein BDN72DRAFT_840280 [Pluteus cervinus]|uniref:Uncharacterized protein n=1 Tax=Pluteus cervinus TaxID=181527 RepID=A0ACD3AVA7_9AGAR|nr:hypothetical protein BDN72DRAFT_840280 [Pluteus cervinus]